MVAARDQMSTPLPQFLDTRLNAVHTCEWIYTYVHALLIGPVHAQTHIGTGAPIRQYGYQYEWTESIWHVVMYCTDNI